MYISAESNKQICGDCVSVDFDDGDHMQIPIYKLRILPDYFTNLYEVRRFTGDQTIGNLNLFLGTAKPTSKSRSRFRRHSAADDRSNLFSQPGKNMIKNKESFQNCLYVVISLILIFGNSFLLLLSFYNSLICRLVL